MIASRTKPTRALSVLDLAFFVLESEERMSNVGPLMLLRPPKGSRAKTFADRLLREMKRRPVGAPFDLVYQPAGLQGLPRLVGTDAVDVDAHCFRHTLPARGTDAELLQFVCGLHEQRLNRSRPLWELHVIDGLARGRIALYMKIHHGMIDGRGMQAVFARFFSDRPDDFEVRAPWEAPSKDKRLDTAAKAQKAAASPKLAAGAAPTKGSLFAALGRQAMASVGLGRGMPLPFIGTPVAIGTMPSTKRCLAYCVLPLGRVRDFATLREAKINDVLLTVLDMALNAYLGRLSGTPLVADMPVALDGASGGNALAILQFPLGAPTASPLERLAQVQQHTIEVKEHVRSTDPSALVTYTTLVHGIPAILEMLGVRKTPVLANAVISNPGGLTEKLYVAGAELEMGLPVSVLAPGQALNITAATYDRHLQIGFLGLAESLPDIQRLADLTVTAFDELVAAGEPARARSTRRVARTAAPARAKKATKPARPRRVTTA